VIFSEKKGDLSAKLFTIGEIIERTPQDGTEGEEIKRLLKRRLDYVIS
jgi:hypothetical protein